MPKTEYKFKIDKSIPKGKDGGVAIVGTMDHIGFHCTVCKRFFHGHETSSSFYLSSYPRKDGDKFVCQEVEGYIYVFCCKEHYEVFALCPLLYL